MHRLWAGERSSEPRGQEGASYAPVAFVHASALSRGVAGQIQVVSRLTTMDEDLKNQTTNKPTNHLHPLSYPAPTS